MPSCSGQRQRLLTIPPRYLSLAQFLMQLRQILQGFSFIAYNADITHTFPVGNRFISEQRILYEIVLRAQLEAIAQVHPGNPYSQIHDTAV